MTLKTLCLHFITLYAALASPAPAAVHAGEQTDKNPYLQYSTLGSGEGLSGNKILSIARDSAGTYWIGSDKGLDRIAEGKIKSYNSDSSFLNKRIRFISVDNSGGIWAATSSGLYRYHHSTDTFSRESIDGVPVIPYDYDTWKDGIYFICKDGIAGQDRTQDSLRMVMDAGSLPRKADHLEFIDDTTCIVTADADGVYTVGLRSGLARKIYGLGHDSLVNDLCVDREGRIWMAFHNNGVICISGQEGSHGKEYRKIRSFLEGHIILGLEECNGKIYVTTDGDGIYEADLSSMCIKNIKEFSCGQLPPPEIESVNCMEIYGSEIWMGTVRHGILCLKYTPVRNFDNDEFGFPKDRGANSSVVSCLREDSGGNIWIGTDGSGIAILEHGNGRKFRVLEAMGHEKVASIEDIGNGQMLISVYNKGIYRYDTGSGKTERITISDEETNGNILKKDIIINLERYDEENVYVLADSIYNYNIPSGKITGPGIYRIKSSSNFWTAYSGPGETVIYDHYDIWALYPDRVKAEHIFHSNGGDINTVRRSGNTLWILKSNSLARIPMTSREFSHVPSDYNGKILSLEADALGNIYLMTDSRLVKMSCADPGEYTIFDSSDGYTGNYFIENVSIRSSSGEIYAGGTAGLCVIHPEASYPPMVSRDISLIGVTSGSEKIGYARKEDGTYRILLQNRHRSAQMEVCLNGAGAMEKHEFRYTVKGFLKTRTVYSDNVLDLSGLFPGRYRIKAAWLDRAGKWQDTDTDIQLDIRLPWIVTLALLIFMPAGCIYGKKLARDRKRSDIIKTDEYKVAEGTCLETVPAENPDRQFLEKLDSFILSNLSNDRLCAQIIIDHMCMGRATFYKKIKSLTGMGIMEYVTRKRMMEASELLKNSRLSISEIAVRTGYTDNQYFSRAFRQYSGTAPSFYRKQHRRGESPSDGERVDIAPEIRNKKHVS